MYVCTERSHTSKEKRSNDNNNNNDDDDDNNNNKLIALWTSAACARDYSGFLQLKVIIIHQTHYEKSDWSRAFSQFTIACEFDMIN